jgi:hypothetical protein
MRTNGCKRCGRDLAIWTIHGEQTVTEGSMEDIHTESQARHLLAAAYDAVPAGGDLLTGVLRRHARRRARIRGTLARRDRRPHGGRRPVRREGHRGSVGARGREQRGSEDLSGELSRQPCRNRPQRRARFHHAVVPVSRYRRVRPNAAPGRGEHVQRLADALRQRACVPADAAPAISRRQATGRSTRVRCSGS